MTSLRRHLAVLLLAIALAPAVVGYAQSKPEMQMQQDIRILQEQIQQLRLAVNALAEQTKAANTRLDGQTELMRTNNANQVDTLRNMQTQVDALVQKVTMFSQQVDRFSNEVSPIRAGLEKQQKTLDRILAAVEFPSPTAPANASTGTPVETSAPLGASPQAAFNQARGFYFQSDYEMAVKALGDFIKSPDAGTYVGDANYWLGMSYMKLPGKLPNAVAAFTTVTENYKTSDKAPDSFYQLGECYRILGKAKESQAAYAETIKLFPDSTAASLAKPRIIK